TRTVGLRVRRSRHSKYRVTLKLSHCLGWNGRTRKFASMVIRAVSSRSAFEQDCPRSEHLCSCSSVLIRLFLTFSICRSLITGNRHALQLKQGILFLLIWSRSDEHIAERRQIRPSSVAEDARLLAAGDSRPRLGHWSQHGDVQHSEWCPSATAAVSRSRT